MPDIIHLLPDNIANQIAAGEVIQRPASAVKELLENAVDAGATEIKLIVNDGGKALIQVIDNGKGMSETDARMAFERHATSKINKIDDLFRIRTMGFRGEALASIAAVAQVELKTKRAEDVSGVFLQVENSVVIRQEPVALEGGTNIAMKNLFFNVPARRNFLKSNAAELRHIVEEFIRVAMAFPEILFSFVYNSQELYHLTKGSLKQRIVQVFGNSVNAKLMSINEQTDYLNITGFVGKPETAKKTRGDQYFFVNNRFIKSPYLHHAIMNAFSELIPRDSFPLYALFIELNPELVDINVHPTKQEIKFEDEKLIYAFVQAAVKHALAQFSVTPTLDFELDSTIQQLDAVSKPITPEKEAALSGKQLYQTFTQKNQAHFIEKRSDLKHWKDLYPELRSENKDVVLPGTQNDLYTGKDEAPKEVLEMIQFHNTYIALQNTTGVLFIHQQNAHERILYERYLSAILNKPVTAQQDMFPATLELTTSDALILRELLPDLNLLGFKLELFGKDTFIVQSVPADLVLGNVKALIENLIEQYKHFSVDLKVNKRERLLQSIAHQNSIKAGESLSLKEMQVLVHDLFQCDMPATSPGGKPVFIEFRKEELDKMTGR
ncbi:MAG: DNA mismatch repair endonuclease MutL [Ferruginibacter sp.]|nr:DNA mismatch repair endonuclease MutL [Ferruginibacter sp.]